MNVSKKLEWQRGAVAQYGEIDLSVDSVDGEEIQVIIPEHVPPPWQNAIKFAVSLFVESYAWRQPAIGKMTVRVGSAKGVPCDTTICALAYVTFHALRSAWMFDEDQIFTFDQSSGSYAINLRTSDEHLSSTSE